MTGIGETCNHIAAAMYRVKAAVRIGLTCTSNANEWLPNGKLIELKKRRFWPEDNKRGN